MSLVVISVGMIGMASMYVQGLGASRTAMLRTQAVNLAADLADRVRGNRQGQADFESAGADHNCDPAGAATCTPAEMAAHEVWVWSAQIGQQLPNGAGAIDFAAGEPPTYTISITWDEVGLGPVTHTIAVQVHET